MDDLTGRTALVTGASKGIGAAIALALAEAGARVVVNYASDADGAGRVVDSIRAAGGDAVAVQADVADPAAVEAMFRTARERLGAVTVLVNNAGVFRFEPLEAVTPAEFHREFDTNVLGNLLVTREFVLQPEADDGAVVNISSVGVSMKSPNSAVYGATKSALVGITQNLAAELAPRRIRVNAIAAGLIDTEGTRSAGTVGAGFDDLIAQAIPLGRLGVARDVAPVAVFLASDAAGWITGDTVFASGGQG